MGGLGEAFIRSWEGNEPAIAEFAGANFGALCVQYFIQGMWDYEPEWGSFLEILSTDIVFCRSFKAIWSFCKINAAHSEFLRLWQPDLDHQSRLPRVKDFTDSVKGC